MIKMNSDFIKMAVFLLETDNSSRRIIRLLFYVSSINTGRTTKRSLALAFLVNLIISVEDKIKYNA